MRIRNRCNNEVYKVTTIDDQGAFCIYAVAEDSAVDNFVMHYSSLKGFTDDWEDPD